MSYTLNYADKKEKFDEVVDDGGVVPASVVMKGRCSPM